jgi:hypothetical protein
VFSPARWIVLATVSVNVVLDDPATALLGELDHGRPQAAGAGVDEDLLARFQVGAVDERLRSSQ